MPTTFLMLPPQSETTREWARRLAEATPELEIIAPETMEGAEQAIGHAEGAFGRIPPARLASAFGMRVIGVDERRVAPPPGIAELHRAPALDTLLPRADFVILTVPHTPETAGFMNRARFQKMKKGAFFINIGRGMTTRLDDLVAALRAGEIAGAGLDVFEREPLPADHPLWTLPGVPITPHTAGYGPYLEERRFDVL